MIPWRLRFSGVRDYGMTHLDLSGKQEHVLISGPNGSGKSTITFCMGAALYSSKVDIEGLRSNNLSEDQTWRASIEFLFRNIAETKVDAPEYVQFRLDIEQHPGDPMKKEFYIEEGDELDQWERRIKYSSGHFFEYKNQLLYKYAVDPDSFYLIWYQQEVNQFAVMHPEERFRIFSQMNGIDSIQKNWEQSKELVKETEQSLQEAESKQDLNKFKLKVKKNELEAFHGRNKRLHEGFKTYYQSLVWLVDDHWQAAHEKKDQIETLHDQQTDRNEEIISLQVALEKEETALNEITSSIQLLESEEETINEQTDKTQDKRQVAETQLTSVSKEIEEVTQKVNQINLAEEEVQDQLNNAKGRYEKDVTAKENHESALEERQGKIVECIRQSSGLKTKIDEDKQKEQSFKELIETYGGSNQIQNEMDHSERTINQKKDRLREAERTEKDLQEELNRLINDQVLSPRQAEATRYFSAQGVEVYPLRDLLELDGEADPKDEQRFDTLKYTMFVNKRHFYAPNDLYYVSLPMVIPKQALSSLPDKHLSIKANLSEKLHPLALKAIWWVHLFFSEDKPSVYQHQLVDQRGIRGPQENKKIILSEKMLKQYQQSLESQLKSLIGEKGQLKQELRELDALNSKLFNRREALKEAEAFLTKASEREWRQTKYASLKETERSLEKEQQTIQKNINRLNTSMARWEQKIHQYEEYMKVYQAFKKEKEKIEKVQQLQKEITHLKKKEEQLSQDLWQIDQMLSKERRQLKKKHRGMADIETNRENDQREFEAVKRQIDNQSEELITEEESYSRVSGELKDLISGASKLYEQYHEEIDKSVTWTRSEAESLRQRSEIKYYQAANQTGIDEAAPENYRKMKEEFDQSAEEVKKSRLLLEEHTDRMERLREDLEFTIRAKIISVHHKFVHYMSYFGFEGEVDWNMYEDKRGQARYRLLIKAKKEGHRAKLEDVSEKARGGKHGKGVSGGEESLSSLLFALALLQTIEATPGYIVLDEFDSALDDSRKETVFSLYERELRRKMIIITPKSHESDYLYRFSKAYIVYHDSSVPKSNIIKVKQEKHTRDEAKIEV